MNSSAQLKRLTTWIATWIRETVVLHDGAHPHGIVYPSKWGTTLDNWAMWLRRADDGTGTDAIVELESGTVGQHVIAEIRTIDPEIVAIVSSCYAVNPVLSNPQEYGFAAKIEKPFRMDDLKKTMCRVLLKSASIG